MMPRSLRPGGDERVRALVLLPGPNVGAAAAERAELDLLARAVLLERRADEKRLAGARDDAGEQALASRPADVGEVDERGAGGQHEGVDLLVRHEAFRLRDAGATLVVRDRPRLIAHRREAHDRIRELRVLLLRLREEGRLPERGESRRCGEELSSIHDRAPSVHGSQFSNRSRKSSQIVSQARGVAGAR